MEFYLSFRLTYTGSQAVLIDLHDNYVFEDSSNFIFENGDNYIFEEQPAQSNP